MESTKTEIKGENLVINANLKSFANLCYKHIIDGKIAVESDKLHVYINDDVLNRFLVARDNKETKALSMWSGWLDWKLEYHPESITERDIENELRSGKAFLHGFDKEGRPCVVVKNCRHIPEKTNIDEFIKFFIYTIETACKLADE